MDDPGKLLKHLTALEIHEQNSRDKPGQSPYKGTQGAGGQPVPPAPPLPQYPPQQGYPPQYHPQYHPQQGYPPPQQGYPPAGGSNTVELPNKPPVFLDVPKEIREKFPERFQESLDKDVSLEEFAVPTNVQSQKPPEKGVTMQELIIGLYEEIASLREEVKRLKSISTTVNRIDKRLAKPYPIETKKKNPVESENGH